MNRTATIDEGKLSTRELHFLRLWRTLTNLPDPAAQYQFHDERKWRFDFAWPELKLAVEIDGGTRGRPVICDACGHRVRATTKSKRPGRELRIGGGHNRGSAFDASTEKHNAATWEFGWSVFHVLAHQIDVQPIEVIEAIASKVASSDARRRHDATRN